MKTAILGALLALGMAGKPISGEIDFATLSGFEYEEGMTLPRDVRRLDGDKVTLSGFMEPEFEGEEDVAFFMLIDDACGCEGMPKLNEIVFCAMPDGETTEILSGMVTVEGTLWVGEQVEDGEVVALYTFDVDSVYK